MFGHLAAKPVTETFIFVECLQVFEMNSFRELVLFSNFRLAGKLLMFKPPKFKIWRKEGN